MPAEEFMLLDGEGEVKSARGTTPCPRFPLAFEAYVGAVVHPGRDFNRNVALLLLSAGALAGGAGVGDNFAVTPALLAGGGVSETPEKALVDAAHLPRAIAAGAFLGLGTGLGANAVAQGAVLGAQDTYLFFTAQRRFLKGGGKAVVKVGATLWSLAGGGGDSAEEGIKYIPEAAKVKALLPVSIDPAVPEAVIGGTLVGVGEDFVGFVDLFEFFPGRIIMVVVRVILEGELAKRPLYFLVRSVPLYAEDFVVITL
jgi:hypothetical protein